MSLRETLRAGVCERLVAGELAESEEAALAARERGEEALTQFGQVMKQLGIEMIPARSPQAKGRVERSYRTLQDRLLKELRLEGVGTRGPRPTGTCTRPSSRPITSGSARKRTRTRSTHSLRSGSKTAPGGSPSLGEICLTRR